MLKNLKCNRIVVKAGTSTLTPVNKNKFSRASLEKLGNEIWELVKRKKEVVLVSSGAIALGMEAFGLMQRPKEMPRLQSCAATGQGKLMHEYELFFSKKGIHTAQLLLTRDGLENRTRSLRARQTLEELLRMKALPIVNENDTIATEEIAFGDNDKLSVYVGILIKADLVVILSDVDGFYLQDGTRVRQVSSLKELDELAGHIRDSRKERTVGGMKAKLAAAHVAMNSGIPLLLVSGHEENILQKIIAGEDVGTLFYSDAKRKNSRKNWIAFAACKGHLIVDHGAYEALRTRKTSLLPRGLVKVRGKFDKGEVVELETADGQVFGRGVVRYSSRELEEVAGKKSDEIRALLGTAHSPEAIHRNDLIVWS